MDKVEILARLSTIQGNVVALKSKPDNCKDKYTVAIIYASRVVSHVPFHTTWPRVYLSFSQGVPIMFVTVTGSKGNHEAGYRLKLPVVYCH